jgi:hypothetical protein
MTKSPGESKEFSIFNPETARQRADELLREALGGVRHAIEKCLEDTPKEKPIKRVRVGNTVFGIPASPELGHAPLWRLDYTLNCALEQICEDAKTKGVVGIHRKDVDESSISRHPELFAALYAWGYLWPREDWEDVIRWEPEHPASLGEMSEEEVLQIFMGFAHGTEGVGITFVSSGRRMCFDPAYLEPVRRVIMKCMGVGPQEILTLDRMQVVRMLLEKYSGLRQCLQDSEIVLEAMVEVIQRGEGVVEHA